MRWTKKSKNTELQLNIVELQGSHGLQTVLFVLGSCDRSQASTKDGASPQKSEDEAEIYESSKSSSKGAQDGTSHLDFFRKEFRLHAALTNGSVPVGFTSSFGSHS